MKCSERASIKLKASWFVGVAAMLSSGVAIAQEPDDVDDAPVPADSATPDAPPSQEPGAPTEETSQAPSAPATEAPATEAPTSEPPATEPATANKALTWSLFIDASYSYSSAHSGTPVAAHRAWETTSGSRLTNNGFNLSWLGLDASYDTGEVGATGSLRFGTAVPVYYGGNKSDLGIENLTQAYVTWKPTTDLKLDLGQFDTIYGAEVAESWKNLNYSRGGLYYAMQPFFHTGLRANYVFNDAFNMTALVVDGVNTIVDDNDKPSLGLQLGITPNQAFSLNVGYLGALSPRTDADPFSHFFDVVATIDVDRLKVILNGDYTIDRAAKTNPDGSLGNASFFGVSAAAGYTLCPMLGFALRYEYLKDSDNTLYASNVPSARNVGVNTLTGTIDLKPVRGNSNLILRWDNRFEFSNRKIFFNKASDAADTWFASIFGVVVTTGN